MFERVPDPGLPCWSICLPREELSYTLSKHLLRTGAVSLSQVKTMEQQKPSTATNQERLDSCQTCVRAEHWKVKQSRQLCLLDSRWLFISVTFYDVERLLSLHKPHFVEKCWVLEGCSSLCWKFSIGMAHYYKQQAKIDMSLFPGNTGQG